MTIVDVPSRGLLPYPVGSPVLIIIKGSQGNFCGRAHAEPLPPVPWPNHRKYTDGSRMNTFYAAKKKGPVCGSDLV